MGRWTRLMAAMGPVWLLWVTAGCTEYDLGSTGDDGTPGDDDAGGGDDDNDANPDFDGVPWDNCVEGYLGDYYNLPFDHPEVEANVENGVFVGDVPGNHDWWDDPYFVFSRYDLNLEFGAPWWPVDTGMTGDPQYFAVHWGAWVVVDSAAPFYFEMGSDDDSWLYINGEMKADLGGIHGMAATTYEAVLDEGFYTFDLWFAERHTVDSGFYFRFTGGDVRIYPADCDDHP